MIKRETVLNVCDNSGAKLVLCIGFFKNIKCNSVGLNDLIRVCVRKLDRKKFATLKSKGKIKKVQKKTKKGGPVIETRLVYRAIVISCKKPWRRFDGTFLKSKKNRVVLISDVWKFLGTKILGPITKEVRRKRFIPLYKELISYARRRV